MAEDPRPADPEAEALRRERAYRKANRLIAGAGIILASSGVPRFAPEMKALAAALRAVNYAGGIEKPKPAATPGKEVVRAYPPADGRRFHRAVP